MCGTAPLKTLFGNGNRRWRVIVKKPANVRPGDQAIIGLNRIALVLSSLSIYLLLWLMRVPGTITGETIAYREGIEKGEFAAILSGSGSALVPFIVVSQIVRPSYFSTLFQPVVLDRE